MVVNERFPVLSTMAKILWGFGILSCVIGVLFLAAELIEAMNLYKPGAEWVWSSKDYLKVSVGILSLASGVLTMILGELIGVLFAIEKNTRQSN